MGATAGVGGAGGLESDPRVGRYLKRIGGMAAAGPWARLPELGRRGGWI